MLHAAAPRTTYAWEACSPQELTGISRRRVGVVARSLAAERDAVMQALDMLRTAM